MGGDRGGGVPGSGLRLIGSLVGVPTQWRDRANRRTLRQTIEGLEGKRDAAAERLAELRGQLHARPNDRVLAMQVAGAQQQLDATQQRLDGPTNLERQLAAVARDPRNRLDARDVYLLDFDPDSADGDGRAVVALGDPSTADHIGVVVPGTDNTLMNVENPLSNAARLRATVDQVTGSAVAGRTATVMWLGYDTPNGRHDAWNKNEAKGGAPALRQFIDELRATHDGPSQPHVSVFGHSYGSTVTGMAAKQGMAADDVVLFASPGAGAKRANDLSVPRGHVWAA